ncbi:MAG: cyclic nucleotide-binding domain-containing protein [Chloroflexi bacterium]|nr:cyclic nucleotide-binding domain-containing protein [Chloroflexota bacterium]
MAVPPVPGVPRLDFGPFALLDDAVRTHLEAACTPLALPRGAVLIREGDPATEAFAILHGTVRVHGGDELVAIGTLAGPTLVGEIAILDAQPRLATVVATEPVSGLRIPAEALLRAVADDATFAGELRAFAGVRVAATILRLSALFSDLPSPALAELSAAMRAVRFAPGDVILSEGDDGDDAFLLRSGEVGITQGGRLVTTLGAGALLGEISVLTGVPRTATAIARTEVRAFRIPGEDARRVVQRHRALVTRLESTMQSRHAPRAVNEVEVAPAPDDPSDVILHDRVRGTYLRLSADSYAIFRDLDGSRSLRDLALSHFSRTGSLDPHGVMTTVATIQAAGFASTPRVAMDEEIVRPLRRFADLVLSPRLELADADPLATRLHRIFGPLFGRAGLGLALVLGTTGLFVFALEFAEFPSDLGLVGLAIGFVGLFLAGLGHEAAHAIATKATGRRVGRAGIGLVLLTPLIYVDTSDAWLIDRHRRVFVNAAGPVFNFALAGVCALAALLATGSFRDLLLWLAGVNLVSVAFNLSPLLEFDGYYVLSDLTNVQRLRKRALRYVFHDLVSGRHAPHTRLQAGFIAYAIASVVYVGAMTGFVLTGVPNLVEGMLGRTFGPLVVTIAGTVVALFFVATLIAPFVNEVRAAGKVAEV